MFDRILLLPFPFSLHVAQSASQEICPSQIYQVFALFDLGKPKFRSNFPNANRRSYYSISIRMICCFRLFEILLRVSFTTKHFLFSAVNICDESISDYCVELSNCTAKDETGFTTFNATCTCPIGYIGNGINITSSRQILFFY